MMVLPRWPLQLSRPSVASAPTSPSVHTDTSTDSPGSQGDTQDLCEKLHRSGHRVGDLDYLDLLLLKVKLIWPVEGRISGKQPSQSFIVLHVHFFEIQLLPWHLPPSEDKPKCKERCFVNETVQEWLLTDCQSPIPRVRGGAGTENPVYPGGSPGFVVTCGLASQQEAGAWCAGSAAGGLGVWHPHWRESWCKCSRNSPPNSSLLQFVMFSWVKICHSWKIGRLGTCCLNVSFFRNEKWAW